MGYFKEKRRILAPQGALVNADVVLSTAGSSDAGIVEPVQQISLSGASGVYATAITNRGVTFITSTGTGAGWFLTVQAPGRKGRHKRIVSVLGGASTVPVSVGTASSSGAFIYGTTKNGFVFTTESSTRPRFVELVSQSSVTWAVLNAGALLGSSVVTFVGTTV